MVRGGDGPLKERRCRSIGRLEREVCSVIISAGITMPTNSQCGLFDLGRSAAIGLGSLKGPDGRESFIHDVAAPAAALARWTTRIVASPWNAPRSFTLGKSDIRALSERPEGRRVARCHSGRST